MLHGACYCASMVWQAKFVMHHARKQRGVSYNETIRNSMPYRNPYLMQQVLHGSLPMLSLGM